MRRNPRSPVRLFGLALALLPAVAGAQQRGERILFIGNSLTYTNDLPGLVMSVAAAMGDSLRVASVTAPNRALIDHLEQSDHASRALAAGPWDHVVLQQGPTFSGMCRDSLVLWTGTFAPLIRKAGAEPALFMTWPALDGQRRFDEVRASYQAAAHGVGGIFLPVGEAWRIAGSDGTLARFYGPDGFHPSRLGSLLAALTIYDRLAGRDVRTIVPSELIRRAGPALTEREVRDLARAAHEANTRFPALVPDAALPPPSPPAPARAGGHC